MHVIVLLIMISGVFSAELPREVERELTTYTAAVAKADAVRQAAVDKAVDAAAKALDAMSRKAPTAEDRRAIDDQIIEIKKSRSKVDDLLGYDTTPSPLRGLVGKWSYQVSGDRGTWEFKADGTAINTDHTHNKTYTVKWEYRQKDGVIHLQWNAKDWDDVTLPLDPKGTKVNNHFYGAGSGTATKLEEKR